MSALEGPPTLKDEQSLFATLSATFEIVTAQRSQIDELQAELARAREVEAELRLELAHERDMRQVTEAKLRDSAVDFAQRLSAMQARVLEAERDVVLGGQVLVTQSAPSSGRCRRTEGEEGHAPGSLSVALAAADAGASASHAPSSDAPGTPRPRPPLARPMDDAALFTRPRVLHIGIGRKLVPSVGAGRRAHSSSQRLDPLEPHVLASPRKSNPCTHP
mmetsp:Transcript_41010/g.130321  ORF Transcript_41010/g.130321 Transcript_41010/m.130321 type:complete len:219 (+) Transcript_41010:122-778(+)